MSDRDLVPHELLGRMAGTLRADIGPAVEDPFAKTQAFMASVILTKLAGQLRHADADARAAEEERRAVVAELRRQLGPSVPADLGDAVDALERDGGGDVAWNRLVEVLYARHDELGAPRFDGLLAVVRGALRARLDRALVYAA